MTLKKLIIVICSSICLLSSHALAQDKPKPVTTPAAGLSKNPFDGDFGDKPTYIKSDSLSLKSDQRVFVYTGNVEVKQGDMILTSDTLEGTYAENNKIQQLTALSNVKITKGENIKANSQKAVYEAATETLVLTDNPELQQNGSVLTADLIRIFLKDDRSVAEGAVRVKVVKEEADPNESPSAALQLKKK